jgi:hypothetical protein
VQGFTEDGCYRPVSDRLADRPVVRTLRSVGQGQPCCVGDESLTIDVRQSGCKLEPAAEATDNGAVSGTMGRGEERERVRGKQVARAGRPIDEPRGLCVTHAPKRVDKMTALRRRE